MFKIIAESRRKGLLKSSLNIALLFAQFVLTVASIVILVVSSASAESSLKLRYTTSYGAYDQGAWYRVILLAFFGVMLFVFNILVAHRLLNLKKPNLITALLIVSFFEAALIFVIALQYAVYARF